VTHTTLDDLSRWLMADEGHHLEFKEAKQRFDFEELVRYCVALANEGGGRIVLGVTDRRPRRVVGTQAFHPSQRTEEGLVERLGLKVRAEEIEHVDGRVLVFHVPTRHRGVPVSYKGAYWMRSGEGLVPMTPDELRRIFDEVIVDFSAETIPGATVADLSADAVQMFRERWVRKSGNAALVRLEAEELLANAELIVGGHPTVAAFALLGTRGGLTRWKLSQAEVVFEYRGSEAVLPAQQRVEFQEGLLLFHDRLWDLVDRRNDRQTYQDGFFRYEIPTFDEKSVREAVLNAVSHRDYRSPGSVFVRQYARHIEVVSPGGFPAGITPENILDRQLPRNRRLADALARCGLVERAGQGANLMFAEAIRGGKPLPDFSASDAFQVSVVIRGEIESPAFLRYLERLGQEKLASFTTHDLIVLDALRRDEPVPASLGPRLARLIDLGAVEQIGRGRGVRHLLSRSLYAEIGERGTYTRRRGLDRETNKELLVRHLRDAASTGSPLSELVQVLPQLSRRQVRLLLEELRDQGRVHVEGERRRARWLANRSAVLDATEDR
jgi:ATP-dependent DNA helicase RecG